MSEKKYVIFKLNDEEYGIDINSIKEVCEHKPITPIPGAPSFVEGVVGLRGDIISVINLKHRLGLEDWGIGSKAKIVVANVNDKQVGLLVDDASHIITIDDKQIESSDGLAGNIGSDCVEGIGKVEERIVVILNLNKIVTL